MKPHLPLLLRSALLAALLCSVPSVHSRVIPIENSFIVFPPDIDPSIQDIRFESSLGMFEVYFPVYDMYSGEQFRTTEMHFSKELSFQSQKERLSTNYAALLVSSYRENYACLVGYVPIRVYFTDSGKILITDNTGGGIEGTNFTRTGSINISRNTAATGGGIEGAASFTATGAITFNGNKATQMGGAVNGWVVFSETQSISISNNASLTNDGGGIYGDATFTGTRGGITISGNKAASGNGGGICGTTIFSGSGSGVTLTSNSAGYEGGAICGRTVFTGTSGKIEISGNTSSSGRGGAVFGDAVFRDSGGAITIKDNRANSEGGAICGGATFSGTSAGIEISGNTSSSGRGGAVFGDAVFRDSGGMITIKNNRANSEGGAICGSATFSGTNTRIEITGNTSVSGDGGAISGGVLFSQTDGLISLTGNMASGGSGGAIYGGASFRDAKGGITISGNSARLAGGAGYGSLNISGTQQKVLMTGNSLRSSGSSYGGAWYVTGESAINDHSVSITLEENKVNGTSGYGGALAVDGTLTLRGNTRGLTFSKNEVIGSVFAGGGAVFVASGGNLLISGNECEVKFTDNMASGSAYARGGAINSTGNVLIAGNDEVEFRGNYEKQGGSVRLRSIYCSGPNSLLSISASNNGGVDIYDSIYASEDTIVVINSSYRVGGTDYGSAGTVRFSGLHTAEDLLKAMNNGSSSTLGTAPTEAQIRNSRTSELLSNVSVNAGTLAVEDGAILKTHGLSVGGKSTLLTVTNGSTLSMSGYDFSLGGTSIFKVEGTGNNLICSSLSATQGFNLHVSVDVDNLNEASLNISGDIKLGKAGVSVTFDSLGASSGLKYKVLTCTGDKSSDYWEGNYLTTSTASGKLEWEGNTLYFIPYTRSLVAGAAVSVKDDSQFGDNVVALSGATLNLNGHAVKNNLIVEGDSSVSGGGAYSGVIAVDSGTLTLESVTTAQSIILNNGVVTGEDVVVGTALLRNGVMDVSVIDPSASFEKTTGGTVFMTQGNSVATTNVYDGSLVLVADGATGSVSSSVMVDGANSVLVNNGVSVYSTVVATDGATIQGCGKFRTMTLDNAVLAVGDCTPLPVSAQAAAFSVTSDERDSFADRIGKTTVETLVLDGKNVINMDLARLSDGSAYNDVLSVTGTVRVEGDSVLSLNLLDSADWLAGDSLCFTLFEIGADVDGGLESLAGHLTVSLSNVSVGFFDLDVSRLGTDGSVTLTALRNYPFKYGPGEVIFETDGRWVQDAAIMTSSSLIVRGEGTLELWADNAFTGGSRVESGYVVATGAASFGSGSIELEGGTIDLGSHAVGNDITATDGMISNAANYCGSLTVDGQVELENTAKAALLTVVSGSLFGGAVSDTPVRAEGGRIESLITGRSSLLVIGEVEMLGAHDYSGGTLIQDSGWLKLSGTLEGDIRVQGGILDAASDGVRLGHQKLEIIGGNVRGGLTMSSGSVLSTMWESFVDGDLKLSGAWVCRVDAGSLLHIKGDMVLSDRTLLDVVGVPTSGGVFTLASYEHLLGDVSSIAFEPVLATSRVRYALADEGTALTLTVTGATQTLTWNGAKGVWSLMGAKEWNLPDGVEEDSRFYNLDSVIFSTKATVTITGDVAPYSMLVAVNGKDALTFSGKGSIVGEGVLTMDGTGTLKMNAANAYTGGTVVNNGTVTATGDKSFGTGSISLNGGTLNLGGKAVSNDISASAGTLAGAAKYAGTLTVDGAVALNGNLLAKRVQLDSGILTGGAIKDTDIVVNDGSITSAISGKSSVTVTGDGALTGKLSYTGGTTLAGGSIASNFTVAAKQTLAASTGSIGGDLTLGGGSILLADNMSLTVSGAMKLMKASTLDVSSLGGSATISFDSLTGDTAKFLKLSAPTEGRKSYAMEIGEKAITVIASGENTDLTWQGAKGKWEVAGTQVWGGSTDDNRFYHGDSVTFNSAATVTLATKLAPCSVTVQGDGAVTFSGSGSIAGDAALTMEGTNTLKMNATNTYTGGTFINSGTVLATGVDSFGKGDITLSGGTLNLGKKAIKNNITVTNNATILNAKGFAGVITVDGGTLSLTDSLTGTLVLNGGTLNLSGVKNIVKLTFGNVVCEAETDIVDAKGQRYAFVGNKLVQVDRTVAATPVPQHAELPGAGLYTTMMRAQLDGNRAAFDSIRQLMGTGEPSSADGRYRFAAQATSASTDMKDYRRQGFGGLVMVEEVFSSKAVGGLSLNYEHADINPDGAGKYESDDTRVNAHLLVSSKNWQSRSIAGIGIHDYDVNHSSATGLSFNLMEEISRTIAVDDKSVIAPFVRVETGYNVIGSINDGVLSIDKQTAWSTDVTLGARFVKTCDFGSVMLEAGVTKAIGDQGGAIGATLVDDPATRAALSPSSRNRWSAVLGGSVQVPMGERSAIQAGGTLRLHGGTTEVNANVGYSIKF